MLLLLLVVSFAHCDRLSLILVSMVSRTSETAPGGSAPDPSCNFTLTLAVPGVSNIAPVRGCKFQDDVAASPAVRVFNELVWAANVTLAPSDAVSVAVALDCSEQNCKLGDSCFFDTTCGGVDSFLDNQRQIASQTLAFARGRDVDLVVAAGLAFNVSFRLGWVEATRSPTPAPPPTPSTTTLAATPATTLPPPPATTTPPTLNTAAPPAPAGIGTPVIVGAAVGASAAFLVVVLLVILLLLRREKKGSSATAGTGGNTAAPPDDDVVVANSAYNRVPSLADSRESFAVPDAPQGLHYNVAPPEHPDSTLYPAGSPPPGYTGLVSPTERQKDVYVEAPPQEDKAKF